MWTLLFHNPKRHALSHLFTQQTEKTRKSLKNRINQKKGQKMNDSDTRDLTGLDYKSS